MVVGAWSWRLERILEYIPFLIADRLGLAAAQIAHKVHPFTFIHVNVVPTDTRCFFYN